MSLIKIKKKLDKIFKMVINYELKKKHTKKEMKEASKRIKKLTEDIRNTPTT